MADIKYVVEVDSTGAVKSVKNLDDVVGALTRTLDTIADNPAPLACTFLAPRRN